MLKYEGIFQTSKKIQASSLSLPPQPPVSIPIPYDQVTNYLENMIFFPEKIIVGPQEGETPPPLAEMVLTQCTSISELLGHQCAIFTTF